MESRAKCDGTESRGAPRATFQHVVGQRECLPIPHDATVAIPRDSAGHPTLAIRLMRRAVVPPVVNMPLGNREFLDRFDGFRCQTPPPVIANRDATVAAEVARFVGQLAPMRRGRNERDQRCQDDGDHHPLGFRHRRKTHGTTRCEASPLMKRRRRGGPNGRHRRRLGHSTAIRTGRPNESAASSCTLPRRHNKWAPQRSMPRIT